MAKANTAQEPTMDQILASIRRMISDEEQMIIPGPHAVSQAKPAKVTKLFAVDAEETAFDPAAGAEDNVIELAIARAMEDARIEVAAEAAVEAAMAEEPTAATEAIAEPEPTSAPMAMEAQPSPPAAEAQPASPPAAIAVTAPEPAAAAAQIAAPPAEPARAQEEASQPLLSPQADVAVAGAFNRLAVSMLSRSARTIDELVEDLLRPLLRSWLDNNLPPLVERLVREEIERVSRGRR